MNRDFPYLEQYSDQSGNNAYMRRENLLQARVCMPVKVLAVTRTGGVDSIGTVDCQPLIDLLDYEGRTVKDAPIYGLPYIRLQTGDNAVIIDPQPGDIGLAVFCDRDISSFMANGGEPSPPGSRRIHSMSDGVYIASIITKPPKQYIQFHGNTITIHSPQAVNVECQIATINAPKTHITGDLQVDGDIVANGDISDHGNKSMAGMRTIFDGHDHNDPQGGTVSPPNQLM